MLRQQRAELRSPTRLAIEAGELGMIPAPQHRVPRRRPADASPRSSPAPGIVDEATGTVSRRRTRSTRSAGSRPPTAAETADGPRRAIDGEPTAAARDRDAGRRRQHAPTRRAATAGRRARRAAGPVRPGAGGPPATPPRQARADVVIAAERPARRRPAPAPAGTRDAGPARRGRPAPPRRPATASNCGRRGRSSCAAEAAPRKRTIKAPDPRQRARRTITHPHRAGSPTGSRPASRARA